MSEALKFENWLRDNWEQGAKIQSLILIDHLSGQL